MLVEFFSLAPPAITKFFKVTISPSGTQTWLLLTDYHSSVFQEVLPDFQLIAYRPHEEGNIHHYILNPSDNKFPSARQYIFRIAFNALC